MSSEIAVSVRNLTKTYRIFGHPGDRIKQAVTFGFGKYHKEFTALEDVSFDIRKGETVGIVGRNGSGKSTLLQLICGILKPTSGVVEVNGRISALLELGAGFNPEFTGRENVYFQGALMGLSKMQMDERFDDIAGFADIGEFIDQPVRTYSSGMFVRLAFAVGVHVSPDILVVDEALSVGDETFQRQCFIRMQNFREAGGNVLFVSHNSNMVASYSDRVILLNEGKLIMLSQPGHAIAAYKQLQRIARPTATPDSTRLRSKSADASYVPQTAGGQDAEIFALTFESPTGEACQELSHGREYFLACDMEFDVEAYNVAAVASVKLKNGFVLGTLSSRADATLKSVRPGGRDRLRLPFGCSLIPGVYTLDLEITGERDGTGVVLCWATDVPVRVVAEGSQPNVGAINFSTRLS